MRTFQLKALLLLSLASMAALSSCMFTCVHGSGNSITEVRKVGDFSKIDVSGAYKIILKQDSSFSIKVAADDNLMKYIHTTVSGDKLRIYSRTNFCNSSPLVIKIGVRNLEEIRASGAVEIVGDGRLITQDMAFKLTGASSVNLELNANRVFTEGSGATTLNLKGQATSHTLDLSGSGKIYAFDFVVSTCTIQSTGASHCQVNVLKELDVISKGASDVEYRGNPATVNDHRTGASSITKVD